MEEKGRVRLLLAENFVLFGTVLSALFWLLEALIHTYIFGGQGFYEQVLVTDLNELWMRLFAVSVIMGFSFHAHRTILRQKQAEADMRRSRDLYSALAESASELIFMVDREFRLTYVNGSAAEFIGKKTGDIIGRRIDEFFEPESLEWQKPQLSQALESRHSSSSEDFFERNGRVWWLDTSFVPLMDSSGTAYAVLGISRDVTAKKKAEEALKDRLDELERFRRVTVGRELRVKELKDRVSELEKGLDRSGPRTG